MQSNGHSISKFFFLDWYITCTQWVLNPKPRPPTHYYERRRKYQLSHGLLVKIYRVFDSLNKCLRGHYHQDEYTNRASTLEGSLDPSFKYFNYYTEIHVELTMKHSCCGPLYTSILQLIASIP